MHAGLVKVGPSSEWQAHHEVTELGEVVCIGQLEELWVLKDVAFEMRRQGRAWYWPEKYELGICLGFELREADWESDFGWKVFGLRTSHVRLRFGTCLFGWFLHRLELDFAYHSGSDLLVL